MLVRQKPFKEWVAVYYDPDATNEEKLLKLLRARRCPRASVDRVDHEKFTAMNPFVSEGEVVQLRIADMPKDESPDLVLPAGWRAIGDAIGFSDKAGRNFISIQVPAKSEQKKYKVSLKISEVEMLETDIEVVRNV
jgi:hypothetical protein